MTNVGPETGGQEPGDVGVEGSERAEAGEQKIELPEVFREALKGLRESNREKLAQEAEVYAREQAEKGEQIEYNPPPIKGEQTRTAAFLARDYMRDISRHTLVGGPRAEGSYNFLTMELSQRDVDLITRKMSNNPNVRERFPAVYAVALGLMMPREQRWKFNNNALTGLRSETFRTGFKDVVIRTEFEQDRHQKDKYRLKFFTEHSRSEAEEK